MGVLYLVALMVGYMVNLTDRLILFPTTQPIPSRARAKEIRLTHGALEIWVATAARPATRPSVPATPSCFVLEFTGNATRAEHVVEETAWTWRPQNAEVWTVNYPGYGKSTGPARLKAIADSALAAYDELERVAAGRPIYVVGTSLGTTAALHVAAQREVDGLLLTNPPPLRELILGRHGWWNAFLLAGPIALGVPRELDSIRNASRVSVPAIIILSDRDEVVPQRYQEKVAASFVGPKRVLRREGRGHNDPVEGSDQLWLGQQIAWLTQAHSRPTTAGPASVPASPSPEE